MTSMMILLALVSLTSIVMLVRTIGLDGYGHRPAPRSHVPDQFAPRSLYRA